MDFIVIQGDIAEQYADALVSPSSGELTMSGGAARALFERGGDELRNAALSKAPVDPGQVAVTKGFGLFADYVIHAVTLEGPRATEAIIRAATTNALEAAEKQDCRSLVFPVLGSGVGNISTRDSATYMTEEIDDFESEVLTDVRIIGHTPESRWEITEVADRVRYAGME